LDIQTRRPTTDSEPRVRGFRLLLLLDLGRRHPLLIVVIIAVAQAIVLVGFGSVSDTRDVFGLPDSIAALAAVVAGILAGPLAGAVVAATGAAAFWLWVADRGHYSTLPTALASAIVWITVGIVSGLLTTALSEREAKRLEAASLLAESRAVMSAQAEAVQLHSSLVGSLLPTVSPRHPRLAVASYYHPREDRLLLGGDFLDVVLRDGGELAVIIGDVLGHSPEAAALGSRLRAAWQGLTLAGVDLQTTARSLNDLVLLCDPESLATAFLAYLDADNDAALCLSAGHPPPLLVLDGDVVPLDVPPALPFGVLTETAYEPLDVELPASWALFLYTDGLIEGRAGVGSEERYGEDRLVGALRRLESYDQGSLHRLVAEIGSANGGSFDDDVAALAVSCQDRRLVAPLDGPAGT